LARSEYLDSENLNTIQGLSQPNSKSLPFAAEKDNSMSLEDVEKTAVLRMLEYVSGNKSEAARRLGITRKTLHKKLKKYGVMP
ncbi:MAG: helix-turn-helix domain-containing protein, partial [Desulfobacterales bacterium]